MNRKVCVPLFFVASQAEEKLLQMRAKTAHTAGNMRLPWPVWSDTGLSEHDH